MTVFSITTDNRRSTPSNTKTQICTDEIFKGHNQFFMRTNPVQEDKLVLETNNWLQDLTTDTTPTTWQRRARNNIQAQALPCIRKSKNAEHNSYRLMNYLPSIILSHLSFNYNFIKTGVQTYYCITLTVPLRIVSRYGKQQKIRWRHHWHISHRVPRGFRHLSIMPL